MCKSFSENRKKKIADGSFYNDCLMPMLNGIHRV